MVTIDDVREVVGDLPRSYEALVRDQVKFRVGRIVYLAFSRDERVMGFAFPRHERDALALDLKAVDDVHALSRGQVDVGLGQDTSSVLNDRQDLWSRGCIPLRTCIELVNCVPAGHPSTEPKKLAVDGKQIGYRLTSLHPLEVLEGDRNGLLHAAEPTRLPGRSEGTGATELAVFRLSSPHV